MNWYEKLTEYFPVEEMKSQQHMKMLLEEKKKHIIKTIDYGDPDSEKR